MSVPSYHPPATHPFVHPSTHSPPSILQYPSHQSPTYETIHPSTFSSVPSHTKTYATVKTMPCGSHHSHDIRKREESENIPAKAPR
ncbi:hypothetical protein N431DRAFT_160563 [Stipitochalara longipes BDJ]|nr:hypothetical protein N431DRAFT_160563 [Stipitochalara longipes BDJ]